ncbi:tetratricopeptide repeat protein [Pseudolabrys taiwanensis]|nr:tetratricopeptide repeat protein [Pseudolabrys taiwanensis]
MRILMPRTLVIAALGLWLAGCNALTTTQSDGLGLKSDGSDAFASASPDIAKAEALPTGDTTTTEPGLFGGNPGDDLNQGKKYFRVGNYGMAERYFRRAVELHPRDAESWIGLAAAYDRLRRFDLADRAYSEAIRLVGPTVEILNNQGYSYMLRGDLKRARQTLLMAQRKDPANRFVQNNLQLLAASAGEAKAVE